MSYKSCSTLFVLLCMATAFLAVTAVAQTQGEAPSTWNQDQNYLATVSHADLAAQQDAITGVRAQIEHWIAGHPNSALRLPAAPPRPWAAQQTAAQMRLVRDAIGTILSEDPDHPFHLGAVNVNVNATVSALSPMADSIDQTEFSQGQRYQCGSGDGEHAWCFALAAVRRQEPGNGVHSRLQLPAGSAVR